MSNFYTGETALKLMEAICNANMVEPTYSLIIDGEYAIGGLNYPLLAPASPYIGKAKVEILCEQTGEIGEIKDRKSGTKTLHAISKGWNMVPADTDDDCRIMLAEDKDHDSERYE